MTKETLLSDYQATDNKVQEERRLTGQWHKGSLDTPEASVKYHYETHGKKVGAKDVLQYLRKTEGFNQDLKGATKSYPKNGTLGAVRYEKAGLFIIKTHDGKILSFGKQR